MKNKHRRSWPTSLNKIHTNSKKAKYNLIPIRVTKIKKISNQCGRQETPQEKNEQRKEKQFLYIRLTEMKKIDIMKQIEGLICVCSSCKHVLPPFQPFYFLISWNFPDLPDKISLALPVICTQLNLLTKLSGFIERLGESGKRDGERDGRKQRVIYRERESWGSKGHEGSRTWAPVPARGRGSTLRSLETSSRCTAF